MSTVPGRIARVEAILSKDTILKTKQAYVRYVSHELRTPLNTVYMGLQLSIDQIPVDTTNALDIERRSTLLETFWACEAALEILNDLLIYDKLQTSNVLLIKENIPIVDFISRCINMFTVQLRSKKLNLKFTGFDTTTTAWPNLIGSLNTDDSNKHSSNNPINNMTSTTIFSNDIIKADRGKFSQVIRNLLSNAIKFTPEGGEIQVSVKFIPSSSSSFNNHHHVSATTTTTTTTTAGRRNSAFSIWAAQISDNNNYITTASSIENRRFNEYNRSSLQLFKNNNNNNDDNVDSVSYLYYCCHKFQSIISFLSFFFPFHRVYNHHGWNVPSNKVYVTQHPQASAVNEQAVKTSSILDNNSKDDHMPVNTGMTNNKGRGYRPKASSLSINQIDDDDDEVGIESTTNNNYYINNNDNATADENHNKATPNGQDEQQSYHYDDLEGSIGILNTTTRKIKPTIHSKNLSSTSNISNTNSSTNALTANNTNMTKSLYTPSPTTDPLNITSIVDLEQGNLGIMNSMSSMPEEVNPKLNSNVALDSAAAVSRQPIITTATTSTTSCPNPKARPENKRKLSFVPLQNDTTGDITTNRPPPIVQQHLLKKKFNQPKPIHHQQQQQSGILVIEVKDSGVGISLKDQHRVFNEIIQFNPEVLQGGGGSGLGLFITKGFIDLHGGKITLHSDGDGLGTMFRIEIPMTRHRYNGEDAAAAADDDDDDGYKSMMSHKMSGGGESDGNSFQSSLNHSNTSSSVIRSKSNSTSINQTYTADDHTDDPLRVITRAPLLSSFALSSSILPSHRSSGSGNDFNTDSSRSEWNFRGDGHENLLQSSLVLRSIINAEMNEAQRVLAESINDTYNCDDVVSKTVLFNPLLALSSSSSSSLVNNNNNNNTTQVADETESFAPITHCHTASASSTLETVLIKSTSSSSSQAIQNNSTDFDSSKYTLVTTTTTTTTTNTQIAQSVDNVPAASVASEIANALSITDTNNHNSDTNHTGSSVTHGNPVSLNLLVVDDSGLNRKMMRRLLEAKGHHCDEAADGLIAVNIMKMKLNDIHHTNSSSTSSRWNETATTTSTSALQDDNNTNHSSSSPSSSSSGIQSSFGYDAILMDFVMPNMNGPTATTDIRKLGYTGPIMGVTGNAVIADKDIFIQAGASHFFTKPLDISLITAAFQELGLL